MWYCWKREKWLASQDICKSANLKKKPVVYFSKFFQSHLCFDYIFLLMKNHYFSFELYIFHKVSSVRESKIIEHVTSWMELCKKSKISTKYCSINKIWKVEFAYLRRCETLWSAREIASMALSAEQVRHTENVFHIALREKNDNTISICNWNVFLLKNQTQIRLTLRKIRNPMKTALAELKAVARTRIQNLTMKAALRRNAPRTAPTPIAHLKRANKRSRSEKQILSR